ncbi:UDP-glycosyltransferase 92A1-like [Pyrus ussuriensis x Pyrus communis]|uniref:UDP-glycosyltransferase 92A1-like n=1 Tax=Pyrus ussuriensis x Pyrus communis TaxID=2448454 RepID=A0A5N5H8Y1_9ROSA|nr:UDP-glycosyltransferase 92A1-like [Pyrus ussuriensis x Pyrus communis]
MLPFMAQGHIIPFLALAKQIQQSTNFTVTIATTPLNIKSLQSTISSASSNHNNIHLAELPFCSSDHDLHPNTETTENLPLTKMINLSAASLALKPHSRRLISTRKNTISETQMMELAVGLEKGGKPFVWVIRPPVGFDLKGEFKASNIGWKEVKKVIDLMMDESGNGGEMRKNAGEIKEKLRGSIRDNDGDQGKEKGSSVKAMEDFVAALLSRNKISQKLIRGD